MASHIGSQTKTDNQWHMALRCKLVQIGDSRHNIIFLKGLCVFRDKIEFPQVFFGGL